MGLDMYLSKKLYIKNWNHMKQPRSVMTLKVRNKNGEMIEVDTASASEVEFEVMYWRKANAIHAWFVDNVQDGVDDCREYYVDTEQLEKLRDLCRKVLRIAQISEGRTILNESEIAEILPSRSGFFFGGTDYDRWYLQDIEYTEKELTNLLEAQQKDREKGIYYDFYYQSSW